MLLVFLSCIKPCISQVLITTDSCHVHREIARTMPILRRFSRAKLNDDQVKSMGAVLERYTEWVSIAFFIIGFLRKQSIVSGIYRRECLYVKEKVMLLFSICFEETNEFGSVVKFTLTLTLLRRWLPLPQFFPNFSKTWWDIFKHFDIFCKFFAAGLPNYDHFTKATQGWKPPPWILPFCVFYLII